MQSISLFWTWWLAQLGSLLPANLTNGSGAPADAVILERGLRELSLIVRRSGQEQHLAQSRDTGATAREWPGLLQGRNDLPRLAVVRLPFTQLLRKSLVLPVAARRNLAEIIGFEIDRETPFQRDEVHWTYVVRSHDARTGTLQIELILFPRSAVDPLVEMARDLGLHASGVEVDVGGIAALIPLGSRARGQWLDAQRPLMPLAAAAVVLAVLAIGTPFAMQQWELAALEARIAELQPAATEVANVRRQAGQAAATIDFLTKERDKSGSALGALAAATASLPDDSYLSTLSMRAGRLTLNGMSPSAAQLIGTLAEAPGLREPAFEAPVTRDADNELESFTISVALAPSGDLP